MSPSEMATLQRLADEVHEMHEEWPEIRNGITRIDARLNEHERRIRRVEGVVLDLDASARPTLPELPEITTEESPTGRIKISKEDLALLRGAGTVVRASKRFGKTIGEKVIVSLAATAVAGILSLAYAGVRSLLSPRAEINVTSSSTH